MGDKSDIEWTDTTWNPVRGCARVSEGCRHCCAERVAMRQSNPGGAYGPIALATDGYSEVMDEFSTGVPVVALHGTNRPELVGQSVSNGCVRIPNDIVTMLADTVPLGTPVFIWP